MLLQEALPHPDGGDHRGADGEAERDRDHQDFAAGKSQHAGNERHHPGTEHDDGEDRGHPLVCSKAPDRAAGVKPHCGQPPKPFALGRVAIEDVARDQIAGELGNFVDAMVQRLLQFFAWMRRRKIGAAGLHQLFVTRSGALRLGFAELHDPRVGGLAVAVRKLDWRSAARGADEKPVKPHRPREPRRSRARSRTNRRS